MLENAILGILPKKVSGRKYPNGCYILQCKRGGCTWWTKGRRLKEAEDKFVVHDIDWHRN